MPCTPGLGGCPWPSIYSQQRCPSRPCPLQTPETSLLQCLNISCPDGGAKSVKTLIVNAAAADDRRASLPRPLCLPLLSDTATAVTVIPPVSCSGRGWAEVKLSPQPPVEPTAGQRSCDMSNFNNWTIRFTVLFIAAPRCPPSREPGHSVSACGINECYRRKLG